MALASARVLWTPNEPWADFMPLLYGEAARAVTFVTKNASVYVVDVDESWWRRETTMALNSWPADGARMPLRQVLGATACGVNISYGGSTHDTAFTTPIAMVLTGDIRDGFDGSLDGIFPVRRPANHPDGLCGAYYCWQQIEESAI